MRGTELDRRVLGLVKIWTVDRVALNIAEWRRKVWAVHPPGLTWPCLAWDHTGQVRNYAEGRTWRPLDKCHVQPFRHACISCVTRLFD